MWRCVWCRCCCWWCDRVIDVVGVGIVDVFIGVVVVVGNIGVGIVVCGVGVVAVDVGVRVDMVIDNIEVTT